MRKDKFWCYCLMLLLVLSQLLQLVGKDVAMATAKRG